MIDSIITIYLKCVQIKYGLQLVKAERYEELLAADSFRQDNYHEYHHIVRLPQTEEIVRPEGLEVCWCLKKGSKVVGTVSLFDPTIIKPYAAYFYDGCHLDFDATKTFELTRIALDRKQQRSDNLFFLLLLFTCYRYTVMQGRNQLLASSHKRLWSQQKRLGGKMSVIADKAKLSKEDCFQARYWRNIDFDDEVLKHYRAYLIDCKNGTSGRVLKKYIRRKIRNITCS